MGRRLPSSSYVPVTEKEHIYSAVQRYSGPGCLEVSNENLCACGGTGSKPVPVEKNFLLYRLLLVTKLRCTLHALHDFSAGRSLAISVEILGSHFVVCTVYL